MVSRHRQSHGKVRPLATRVAETEEKLDKMYLQQKIQELRDRVKKTKSRRR